METKLKSFISIFKDEEVKIKCIEIPIIQRDYAQGRNTKEVKRIRENFLDVLYNALTEEAKNVKLDFIYGNIDDGKLIPLDGQQRLTTLFLLHWYIAKKEDVEESQYSFLKRFTYRTRFSSHDFCEGLIKCSPDYSLPKLSDWITDQSWFMYAWENDPTIKSMLVMIDEIHYRFKEKIGIWQKLYKDENPPISFYFLPLEDMGLTDSLYIKMNSRGKPLTNFEHFKAEFEKIIKQVDEDLYKEFVKKADIDWVDMLWKYRGDDDIIDNEYMNYFRFVTEILCYLKGFKIVENDFDLANSVYGNKNKFAEENLRFLFKSIDCWNNLANIDDFFNSVFSKNQYETNKVKIFDADTNLFKRCCKRYSSLRVEERRSFTLNNILLLYGVLEYLINKSEISNDKFIERIRIIRNLVFNSSDEIRRERLQSLLIEVKDIIVEGKISIGTMSFNEIQKKEELDKLTWRKENINMVEDINHLEDHFILQGSIAIIGLEEPEKLKVRSNNFRKLFNKTINYLTISRALLSIDDYSQLASWRTLFGNENDSTWKELFTKSKQRKNFEKTQSTLLELLDSLKGDFNDYLINLVKNYLDNPSIVMDWRYYFIKYKKMRSGKSGVFYWNNKGQKPYEIIMMNTSKALNGKHWDPFLYVLYDDESLRGYFSLEEYNAPLIINKTNQKILCKNERWEIINSNGELENTIVIPQLDGTDTTDRIELLKSKLTI